MADSSINPGISIKDLVDALMDLPPDQSVLIVGPHGVGKSMISRLLAERRRQPHIDRRLAQMTEGDMIGMPVITDDVTRFLPVDWFMRGCVEPITMLLDEINRATPEIMNASFQVVLDRELNGNKLNAGTYVYACVNSGGSYNVNEMDPAFLSRFAVFHVNPTVEDWITWARTSGIDSVIVDYIVANPDDLRWKEVDKMQPMTKYPDPRSWEKLDKALKFANKAPSAICGKKTLPHSFFLVAASLIGNPAAIRFCDFVRDFNMEITVLDIYDNYEANRERVKTAGHDRHVALLEKMKDYNDKNRVTPEQVKNWERFAKDCLTGEDLVIAYKSWINCSDLENVMLFHGSEITNDLIKAVNESQAIVDGKN